MTQHAVVHRAGVDRGWPIQLPNRCRTFDGDHIADQLLGVTFEAHGQANGQVQWQPTRAEARASKLVQTNLDARLEARIVGRDFRSAGVGQSQ